MSSNIGSNIVLNSMVLLKSILNAKGNFADIALEAGLPSFFLLFLLKSFFGQENKQHIIE